MSNAQKIASLQALLGRIQRNAALPRANGAGAHVPALVTEEAAEMLAPSVGADDFAEDLGAPRPRMETFAGDDVFDDDDIVELDEDDSIEILEESQVGLDAPVDDRASLEAEQAALEAEQAALEAEQRELAAQQAEAAREAEARAAAELAEREAAAREAEARAAAELAEREAAAREAEARAAAELAEREAAAREAEARAAAELAERQAAEREAEARAAAELAERQAAEREAEARAAAELAERQAAARAVEEREAEAASAASQRVDEEFGFDVAVSPEPPAARDTDDYEVSLTPPPAAAKPPADAFDDLDFDDEPEADVSSVQPAIKREPEYAERSAIHAAASRDHTDVDVDFDLDERAEDPEPAPASSPRTRPAESMDEALQSAAALAPMTPPPESGRQTSSERAGAMNQALLEEALVRESAVSNELPDTDDIDDLLQADVSGPVIRDAHRPELPTMEQLGQTVDLEEPMGAAALLELDPQASAEVAESQGPRVRVASVPAEELEMQLPSRPSGAWDINLKPPPEVGAELAELKRREVEREERRSAPHHALDHSAPEADEAGEPSEALPPAIQAAVAASAPAEAVARAAVVLSDSVVERTGSRAAPASGTFAEWLNASLSLSGD